MKLRTISAAIAATTLLALVSLDAARADPSIIGLGIQRVLINGTLQSKQVNRVNFPSGSTVSGNTLTVAGGGGSALPVVDTTSLVEDPVDATKEMRIDVGAVATGTIRTLTFPNQNIDLTPTTGSFAATAHASRHVTGGGDAIQLATGSQPGLMSAAFAAQLAGYPSHIIPDVAVNGTIRTQQDVANHIDGNSLTIGYANNTTLHAYDLTFNVTTTPANQTAVGATRSISTTAPITGGGDLSANRTIAMAAATTAADGYMTSTYATALDALCPVPKIATVNTTNATNTAIGTAFSLPTSGSVYVIDVDLFGRLTSSDGSSVAYKRRLVISNDSGTLTARHTLTATGYDGESTTPTNISAANGLVAPTLATTNATMNVQGIAGTNITWTMFACMRTLQ